MTEWTLETLGEAPDLPHETTLGTRRAFDGHLLHVRVDDVRLPSGRESVREVVEHPGSVVVVAVTTDRHVLLIRQYRHLTGEYLIELPAGLLDPDEEPRAAGERELVEETGHRAASIRDLATVWSSPGYTTERSTLLLAEGCEPVPHDANEDEPIQLVRVPLAAVPSLLEPGARHVHNAQAMLGLMWLVRLGMV